MDLNKSINIPKIWGADAKQDAFLSAKNAFGLGLL